ncbi:MAG: hypothetical protein LUO89_00835 [Methanothrix sp.]|nr:hypothetical protein [Methanothrix sp.]
MAERKGGQGRVGIRHDAKDAKSGRRMKLTTKEIEGKSRKQHERYAAE